MKQKRVLSSLLVLLSIEALLSGCGTTSSNSATEDSSTSGAATSAISGALSGSGSSGTQAFFMPPSPKKLFSSIQDALDFLPHAFAATQCPTFKTTSTGCTVSTTNMWLAYSSCNFGSSSASWSGTQGLFMSTGTAACGTFPNPGASGTLTRQWVTGASSTTAGTATVTSSFGTQTTIDHTTADLGNFNNDTISKLNPSGYGIQVTFGSGGTRSSIVVAQRVYSTGLFDHSISGTVTITETAGASSRTVSGTVKVYHNLLKVIGTSTFNSVTHSDSCCTPTSGSITTAFTAGSNVSPTTNGTNNYVGKSETLTFTGCGTATLVGTDGSSKSVTLSRCF